jgi:hypothetical protein
MKKLLFLFDTDTLPNTFDVVVGYDGGADHVTPIGGVDSGNVSKLVEGLIFTRPPASKKFSAIFVTGSNMAEGESLLKAIRRQFFGQFRVSIMLDSNGSNTTAAAAIARVGKDLSLAGKRAVLLAGTGPVGQRAAVMLAQQGAEVTLASRLLERAEAACLAMGERFKVKLTAAATPDLPSVEACLAGAHLVMTTGAAGIELLPEALWASHPTLEAVIDSNATPPLGITGIEMQDCGMVRHGKRCYGALGFGGLKLELQRHCVAQLFESNDRVFDAPDVLAAAQTLVLSR